MLTVDAELIRSKITEQYFLTKWHAIYSARTRRFEMPITSEAITFFMKTFNGDTILEDEFDRVKNSFNRQLNHTIAKYEYNSMIHLIGSTSLLIPKEIISNLDDPTSPEAQYKTKLINQLLPFLKVQGLIDSPTI